MPVRAAATAVQALRPTRRRFAAVLSRQLPIREIAVLRARRHPPVLARLTFRNGVISRAVRLPAVHPFGSFGDAVRPCLRSEFGEIAVSEQMFIEDLAPGVSRSLEHAVTEEDIEAFGKLSGDRNPVHFDDDYARGTRFGGRIAHGMLTAAFVSTLIGMQLPGKGAVYLEQTLRFLAPVRPGDRLVVSCTVRELDIKRRRARLDCLCRVGETDVLQGEATILVASRGG